MTNKKENFFSKFFKQTFTDLFEVTIYELGPDGVQFENKLQLSRIDKINEQYIKGRDTKGLRIEYRAKEPFSYYVKQLY